MIGSTLRVCSSASSHSPTRRRLSSRGGASGARGLVGFGDWGGSEGAARETGIDREGCERAGVRSVSQKKATPPRLPGCHTGQTLRPTAHPSRCVRETARSVHETPPTLSAHGERPQRQRPQRHPSAPTLRPHTQEARRGVPGPIRGPVEGVGAASVDHHRLALSPAGDTHRLDRERPRATHVGRPHALRGRRAGGESEREHKYSESRHSTGRRESAKLLPQ